MKRSDIFGLAAVVVGSPHLSMWPALALAVFWAGMAIYLESKGK